MERRLAAIFAADVVGYSRLMGEDEAGTLDALRAHRAELIEPKIAEHEGRVVKLMGDGLLAEFPSAVEAVHCAVEIQHTMGERNANVPAERRIIYRIGINIGDIIVEGDDIYGDGVNIAARLEGLADPGGISISHAVHTQIAGKLDLEFEDLGEQQVKNIAKPVMVYRVTLDESAAALVTPVTVTPPTPSRRRWPQIAAGLGLSLVAVVGLFWWQPWAPDVEPASLERMAFPLPDKPSVVVLPFTNLSDDPSQEYFADGMTEDLITDLSKISGLFVIARNSSFYYKGQQVKVRQVAEDLGVRYVLEGSVRRAGDTVRINAQLIDAMTGGHIWADRYDGTLADVFALQDQVTRNVVVALSLRLTPEGESFQAHPDTTSLEAYDQFLKGWEHYKKRTPKHYAKALTYFAKAVELDSDYGLAHAAMAWIYWNSAYQEWSVALGLGMQKAKELARISAERALKHPCLFSLCHS